MSSRNGRRARRHFHLTAKPLRKGEAPAFAGAVPPVFRRTGAPISKRTAACTCPPLIPGWPDAIVKVAAIHEGGFWGKVDRPFVFRLVSVPNMTREEEDAIEAGVFTFVVRPGREDADAKALVEMLKAQGGPVLGEPVDLSGAGKMLVQIVAVLTDATR